MFRFHLPSEKPACRQAGEVRRDFRQIDELLKREARRDLEVVAPSFIGGDNFGCLTIAITIHYH